MAKSTQVALATINSNCSKYASEALGIKNKVKCVKDDRK